MDKTEDVKALLEGYHITTDIPDEEAMHNILKVITDVSFYAPTLTIAHAWPKSTFVYHFNEKNPWDGPFKGEASHVLDIAFLFQNYNEKLDAAQASSGMQFAVDFVSFVNGEDPYPLHDLQHGGAQVYGIPSPGNVNFVKSTDAKDYGRRNLVWQLESQIGLDRLAMAMDMFIAGF